MEITILHVLPTEGTDGILEVFPTEYDAKMWLRQFILDECWDYDTMGHPDDCYDPIVVWEATEDRICYQVTTRTVDKPSGHAYCY